MLKILFLCTGNSCRSQMAEGWARHLKSDVLEPYSAGIETHGLNPNAVQVMQETGVDISNQQSQHVNDLKDVAFDYVITVCGHAHESCPVFPGKTKVVHVGFDDPPKLAQTAVSPEEALDHYRRVRDEIRAFVAALPENLYLSRMKAINRASTRHLARLVFCVSEPRHGHRNGARNPLTLATREHDCQPAAKRRVTRLQIVGEPRQGPSSL